MGMIFFRKGLGSQKLSSGDVDKIFYITEHKEIRNSRERCQVMVIMWARCLTF